MKGEPAEATEELVLGEDGGRAAPGGVKGLSGGA